MLTFPALVLWEPPVTKYPRVDQWVNIDRTTSCHSPFNCRFRLLFLIFCCCCCLGTCCKHLSMAWVTEAQTAGLLSSSSQQHPPSNTQHLPPSQHRPAVPEMGVAEHTAVNGEKEWMHFRLQTRSTSDASELLSAPEQETMLAVSGRSLPWTLFTCL